MDNDLLILKALQDKTRLETTGIPEYPVISRVAHDLLKYYKSYFLINSDSKSVDLDSLECLINLKEQDNAKKEVLIKLIETIRNSQNVPDKALDNVYYVLAQNKLASEIAAVVVSYESGKDINLEYEVSQILEKYKSVKLDNCDDFISLSIDTNQGNDGITWKTLPVLSEYISPLQKGTSVLLGARPETGKTSFLCQTAVDFAKQSENSILILCNEEVAERYPMRIYSSGLGVPASHVRALSEAGKLFSEFENTTGFSKDKIKLKNIHGYTMTQIKNIVKKVNPSVVILDLMANVRASLGKSANGAELLESLWIEWRGLLAETGSIGIAATQLHNDADGMLYPELKHVQGSKTGVQGAVDVAIMLGRSVESDIRGLSIVKNKLKREGKPAHINTNLKFEPDICRFY